MHLRCDAKKNHRWKQLLTFQRKRGWTINIASEALFKHACKVVKKPSKGALKNESHLKDVADLLWYTLHKTEPPALLTVSVGEVFGVPTNDACNHIRTVMLPALRDANSNKKKKQKSDETMKEDHAYDLLEDYIVDHPLQMTDQWNEGQGVTSLKRVWLDLGAAHRRAIVKYGSKLEKVFYVLKDHEFPPLRDLINEGFAELCGVGGGGKTLEAGDMIRAYCQRVGGERFDDDTPLDIMVHKSVEGEAKRGTAYQGQPVVFQDDCQNYPMNEFLKLTDNNVCTGNCHLKRLYSVQNVAMQQGFMIMTGNRFPLTDLFHEKCKSNPEIWVAIRRRCKMAKYWPTYKITDENDPTSVERDDDGKPVLNQTIFTDGIKTTVGQSFDLTETLKSMTYVEACELKIKWMNQLGDMSDEDIYRHSYGMTGRQPLNPLTWRDGRLIQ